MVSREAAAGEHRKTQSPITITTALTIATVAVIIYVLTPTLAQVIVGAAAGAPAGVATLQLLWTKANTGKAAIAVPAVAGGLAGTTAALFLSLLGARSLTGSAITGAITGAAIVTMGRTKLQWAIETIQSIPYTLCKQILKLLCKAVFRGPTLAAAAAADIFSQTLQAGKTATRAAASELAALGPASGPAVSGPEASLGLAASETRLSTPGSSRPTASEPGLSTQGGQGSSVPATSGPGAPESAASGPASSGPTASELAASGPRAPESTASGPESSEPGAPDSARSGPESSGPGAPDSARSGPGSSGPGAPESASSGPGSSGPRASESAGSGPGSSGPGAPDSATSGPGSSGPRAPESAASEPGSSGPGAPESASSGPGSSGPRASESAGSGPGSSGPGAPDSATSGPGSSGPRAPESAASGPGSSGPGAPESASSGPGSSGPRAPESAASGPEAPESARSGPGAPESTGSGPASSGPGAPESTGSGPGTSGPGAPESTGSGPGSSGPTAPDSATSGPEAPESATTGPASSGPRSPESAASGPGAPESATTGPASSGQRAPESAASGPEAPESATSEPTASGPEAPASTASGPGAPESESSEPTVSGQDASGPASSTPIFPALFAGANAAAGAVGGLVGGFVGGLVARAGSDMDISQQKGQSQAKSTVMKDESSQTDKSLQTEETSKTHTSLQTEVSSQTDESSMTDKSLQTDESSKTDKSTQTEDSPKINRFLQRDESSQTSWMTESSEITDKTVTGNSIPDKKNEDPGSNYSVKGEPKNNRPARNSPDQQLQQEQQLFYKLHLNKNKNVLRRAEVLQFTAHPLPSHQSCSEGELVQTFIQKLLMMDYRARYIKTHETIKQCNVLHRDISRDESGVCDIFDEMSSVPNEGASESERIHPMDVQMAVFHCADGLLKQLMVTKLSQCQFALPLLVPDPFTRQIEFPLWTFRQINKSWRIRNPNNEIISQTQPIYKAQTPMVFFFRFGSVSSSKSQLMNSLINEKHNTFFHRNCPGSSRTRVLMDGVVEIAWFCPSGKDTDKFTDCVAFCNLHGDAGDHEEQINILTEMASVNVVLLPRLDRNDRSARIIQNLYRDRKPLICLFTEDESTVTETKKWKFKIGLKERNQTDVSEELRRTMNDCLSELSSMFRLEDVSKHSDIRVDEEDDEDCRRGREAAQKTINILHNKDLREIKASFLPHQGDLWHQWCQRNKELHRGHGDETEMEIQGNHTELMEIHEQQHRANISELMRLFTKEISSYSGNKMVTLKWFQMLLNEHTSTGLAALHHKFNEKWSAVEKLKENQKASIQFKGEQAELERIYRDLQAASFGLEHIMREIGQIYESCSSVKKNNKDLQVHFSSLPNLAAEMMISGFPLELMDGDAAHVPVIWISAVLDQLIQKLGNQTRVFVLSVLGTQSSGKSTMLNAMFGHEFPISSGRCTRGAFMQLVKVSEEMKPQMNFDYILVVDTEGLRALEQAERSTRHHDNELATFVAGLGNLTLINIFGENPSEMQDILQIVVQAFMRMKKVRLNPSCVFVHQNVSDVTAGEKNMEGRRRLMETLDEMTKLAAKEEVCDAESFSDVIRFDVQKDVKYFSQLWEGSPPMAPPNPNYCENIQELKEYIKTYASKSHGMMLPHLKDHIEDLWEAVLKDHFIFSFRNSLEISAYRKLETEYSRWSLSLRSAMMETENKLHNQIENEEIHEVEEADLQRELEDTSEEVEKSMSEFFEKDRDANMLIQWKTLFEMKIKKIQENIIRETLRKLNEVLQQQNLKKAIDAQRTHHENALYEKSKELALNLKDKAKDEETIKKEFDTFWEQSVKKIIKDSPPIKDIDVMRDVREILCDVYKSAPVDHWTERMDVVEIYVSGYSDYLKLKKLDGKQGTNAYRSVEWETDYIRSQEVEDQIISLITDVVQQTDSMIKSFNISEMGYNTRVIQQLIDYIKIRVTEHEEGPVKYVFKNEFFTDLVYSIFNLKKKKISNQQRLFREANDLVVYAEKKREEYYNIFQKYCHEAASAVVFGEIICEKLKEPIEQSLLKKTARYLTDEIEMNCESLNGNRSKLGENILKTLAKLKGFQKNGIQIPRALLNSLIRDEVSRYTTDHFNVTASPKMKENIELLQQKILTAAHESTEHVQLNSGDVGLWLKSFTQKLSDDQIVSVKHLSGVKLEELDINILEDVIRDKLPNIMSDIRSSFNTNASPVNLAYKFRPDEILINQLCQCCWLQFCRDPIKKSYSYVSFVNMYFLAIYNLLEYLGGK